MPAPLGAGAIVFSGCPSVRPSVRSLKCPLSICTWVRWSIRPTVTVLWHVHSSVRLARFMGIWRRMHGGNGLKFFMLMYLNHLHNWLDYSHGLLIIKILGFPGISQRMHGGNGLKFCMLMYLDHLQKWWDYGHGLLIFKILALFWLSETGQIWGFRAFTAERMEGIAWNFACWCILITFRAD